MSQHALHCSDGPSPSHLRRSTYFPDQDTRRYSTYFPDQDSPTIGRVQQVNLVLPDSDPLALDFDSHSPVVSQLGTKLRDSKLVFFDSFGGFEFYTVPKQLLSLWALLYCNQRRVQPAQPNLTIFRPTLTLEFPAFRQVATKSRTQSSEYKLRYFSPPSTSPNRSAFSPLIHDSFPPSPGTQELRRPAQQTAFARIGHLNLKRSRTFENTFIQGQLSPPATPITPLPGSIHAPFFPNDTSSLSEPIVTATPSLGHPANSLPTMAGGSSSAQVEKIQGAPRTASIDSSASTMSSKNSADALPGPAEVASLIKTAGSPESLIQYLLKEKQSQSQQNAQLWRLVDKQRAMILGLNKDLERALKDKEKYRKKMKEVMAVSSATYEAPSSSSKAPAIPRLDVNAVPVQEAAEVPASPSNLDSDSVKHSPIDMAMAPYPITPPADQMSNGPTSAVGELLNPSHAMPKPSEHALGHFDHEEEERVADAADAAKKAVEEREDIPMSVGLPPARSPPSDPPSMPPPAPPVKASKMRCPYLRNGVEGARGEEDDRVREMLALQEAERRSLSKKSKKGSQKGTPKEAEFEPPVNSTAELAPPPSYAPASLAGVLNGDDQKNYLTAPLPSPGLPASPRPADKVQSPPLSPRSVGATAGHLSPRAPRQPIPLPPNTSGSNLSISPGSVPAPLSVSKLRIDPVQTSPTAALDSPTERTKVYKGFVTEEYPDLLLPPNALPSITVKVASSRMKPSRASLISLTQLEEDPVFTLAVFLRSEGGELWRVEKDIASLSKLDQRLKNCQAFTSRTPDRSLFTGHAPAKLDARRIALNLYLEEALNTPLDTPTALELCKYLSTNILPPNSDDTGSVAEAKVDTSTQKTGAGGRPFKTGYLTKRGKNFGGWKARFFVLDGPLLKYYETPGGAHLGTIKLQNAQIGKQQSQQTQDGSPARGPNNEELDNQYRHAFLVLEPKKKDSTSHVKHVLCAESDSERDQWVDTLLRWIDYRDPDAEASKTDRRGSASNGKKSRSSASKPQAVRTSSQDDVRLRDGRTLPRLTLNGWDLQQEPCLPAPREMPSKSSLVAPGPTMEEKKQRKRSFFGFGPKQRSSTDDQDSLFGSSVGSSVQGVELRGINQHQVFGSSLGDAVRFSPPVDVNVPLPSVVFRCIQYLDSKNAILEEGIFRLSGSNVVIKGLRERFNVEGDVNLLTDETYYDIHAVASLLKLYLRELPTTILTRDLHLQFLSVTEMSSHPEKIAALAELVQHLPQANGTLLRYLIAFLIKIINNSDVNKMTVRNVGIVFSPTLNIPAPVFALLLQNYEGIFGMDPEEYELPSPASDSDSRSVDPQPRRPSTGTGGAASSPHRRVGDVQQQHQRSTPTPPLGRSNQAQPAQRPNMYDPQYLAQATGAHLYNSSSRPAYEGNGYGLPATYEPAVMGKQPPAYDRPLYPAAYEQAPAGYEQNFAAKTKRRESSLMMNNMLHHQGSKSRLRDETRM
ncbi:hypothetical protein PG994_010325 [Apiospora phragmitis]|uniref:Uncharacterized protein n=1 Tax=Apiospora phragmitis TaxID=2905665 RepID=A0ABR1TPJ7_9PEZI